MKHIIQLIAIFCAIGLTPHLEAKSRPPCHPCEPCERSCWKICCFYEPVWEDEWNWVMEPHYHKETVCVYVKKCHEVERCRYVPEYHDELVCIDECHSYIQRKCEYVPEIYTEYVVYNEPQYTEISQCKMVKRWVRQQTCRYKPKYYRCPVIKEPCTLPCCPARETFQEGNNPFGQQQEA